MATNYPSVDSFTAKIDGTDYPKAADINNVQDPVLALEYASFREEGFLSNGKIAVSVASNNITVALKTQAGADATATTPIYVKIGGAVRTITAALSVTKNAGTGWCNAGSVELATKEIDYFVYLGYNATDGVVIGFSRIPYANQYSDFSVTTTNEKYAAISTITTAASTDYYNVIGRFAATLSASANYYWSVPAYTAINFIQRPIYETRMLSWTPILAGWSANPTFLVQYKFIMNVIEWTIYATGAGTSNATTSTFTLPFNPFNGSNFYSVGSGVDGSGVSSSVFEVISNTKTVNVFRGPGNTVWTNSGSKYFSGEGFYNV